MCQIKCDLEVLGTRPSSQSGPGSVAVTNGMVTYTGVTTGSVATLECDSGYSPVNNSVNRTCLSTGHWSGEALSCVQIKTSVAGNSDFVFVDVSFLFPHVCRNIVL